MIISVITSVGLAVSSQAAPMAAALEVADVAPAATTAPESGESSVPTNASLLTTQQVTAAFLVDDSGAAEDAALVLQTAVQGVFVAQLPEQAQNANVHVRLEQDFDSDGLSDFDIDVEWTTGAERIGDGAHAAPAVVETRIDHPVFENARAVIEVAPDPERAALVIFKTTSGQRQPVSTQLRGFGQIPTSFVDFGYAGGVETYEIVSVDRRGVASDATDASVDPGGCNAVGASTNGALAGAAWLVLSIARAARRRARRPATLGA